MASLTNPALQVEKVRLAYEQVADQLLNQIYLGVLTSGDQLPSEQSLAESFGVSRNTVREALRVLTSRGLIYSTRGRTGGTFIGQVRLDQVGGYLESSLGLILSGGGLTVAQLYETREALDLASARLAAERRTEQHLDAMMAIVHESRGVTTRIEKYREHRVFHQLVAEAAGNPLISTALEALLRVLGTRTAHHELPQAVWDEADVDHVDLVDALRRHDGDGAVAVVRRHARLARWVYLGEAESASA